MTKQFKKFLTESELKLDPSMRVGDTLRLNINAKQVVEMRITDISNGKITVEAAKPDYLDFDKDGDEDESMKKALKDKEDDKVEESAKPDYLDFDKDGDEDESMKKALKDKEDDKVEESLYDKFMKRLRAKSELKDLDADSEFYSQGGLMDVPNERRAARLHNVLNPNKPKRKLPSMNDEFDESLDDILKLSGIKAITRESSDVSHNEVSENKGNIFAAILKNAGVKVVEESDLNSKTNEGILKNIKRAARGWPEPKGIVGDANKPKDIVARVRSADDEFLQYLVKKDVAPHSPAGLQKAAAEQELRRRANRKTFTMNEGKIIVDHNAYDLTLNNARRTWTANIWSTKKVF